MFLSSFAPFVGVFAFGFFFSFCSMLFLFGGSHFDWAIYPIKLVRHAQQQEK
jgi:hypothetical protein